MDNATPPRPRRRWQFSLRELLLLTVIVGLSLTVWRMASGELEPTPFLKNVRIDWAVQDALGKANAARLTTGKQSQLVAHQTGADQIGVKHLYYCQFPKGSAPPASLPSALQSRLKVLLTDAGCEVIDDGVTHTAKLYPAPPVGFFINYRRGKTCGLVSVDCVFHGDVDVLEVYVLIHEFLDR